MKTYIKPNTDIMDITLEGHLLTISGDENQKQGSSNGDYTESGGITLGSRRSVWGDEEEFEDEQF